MLARVRAMAAGLHLNVFDFRGAEALQSEARDLTPPNEIIDIVTAELAPNSLRGGTWFLPQRQA